MANVAELVVEVIYATRARQEIRTVRLPAGSVVEQAIRRSGLLVEFPEIDLTASRVGVYGEPVELDAILEGGERVEIYRPLIIDPKEARRKRAKRPR